MERKKNTTLKRRFINEVYGGDYRAYLKARKDDYLKVQFEWSCYTDSLCKAGEISQKVWERAVF